jgi:hypothetical protein
MGTAMMENLARTYLSVGEYDLLFPLLAHSLQSGAGTYANELRMNPAFDPVRDDPRFQKLLARPDVVIPVDTEITPKPDPLIAFAIGLVCRAPSILSSFPSRAEGFLQRGARDSEGRGNRRENSRA